VSLSSCATEDECAGRVWRTRRLRIEVVGVRQARVRDWDWSEARDERQK
jgi:hypothetical protein